MEEDKSKVIRKYMPSNGSEGMGFMSAFCDHCIHHDPDGERQAKDCDILIRTMCHSINDPEYPNEWQYGPDNRPTCTKYKEWDWDENGDPDDPDNPNAPVIIDPNQLTINFD